MTSPAGRRIGVVVNASKPEAPGVIAKIRAACAEAGLPEPLVLGTTLEDFGRGKTRDAVRAGCTTVIAVGGDGTLRQVAGALVEAGGGAPSLGVVPLGTANLFARNLGLPHRRHEDSIRTALHGGPAPVDTVRITLTPAEGPAWDEVSLVFSGCGWDAQAVVSAHSRTKARAGWLTYGAATVKHMFGTMRRVEISRGEEAPEYTYARSVMLVNCGRLPAGMAVAPQARYDDALLETVVLAPRTLLGWAAAGIRTALRVRRDLPVMRVSSCEAAELSFEEPTPVHIDGDAMGEVIGVRAQVQPASLHVTGAGSL